jgi:hypothetical protein
VPPSDFGPHRAAISELFTPLKDPELPKDWSAENYKNYEAQKEQVARFRGFQQSMVNVAGGIVEIAPGYNHHFSSPEEVRKFGDFAKVKAGGVDGTDLLKLYRFPQLIKDAEERGARNYEAKLKAGGVRQPVKPGNVTVVPTQQAAQPARADSIQEILRRNDPAEYAKFFPNK